jgi:hypothetical protein
MTFIGNSPSEFHHVDIVWGQFWGQRGAEISVFRSSHGASIFDINPTLSASIKKKAPTSGAFFSSRHRG